MSRRDYLRGFRDGMLLGWVVACLVVLIDGGCHKAHAAPRVASYAKQSSGR